jgi:hypothetical protein
MSGAITDVLESTARLADHGEGADFAKTLHDEGGEPAAKRPKTSGGLWDDIVSGAQSAAGAVNNGVHALGHAAETTAQKAITATTGAVRDVAGDGAARAFNSAAEGALNTAKQAAGFTYGVGEGAAGAVGDMVKGTADLARDGVTFATDSAYRGQVVQGAEQLAGTVARNPVGTAKAIGSGVVNAGENWLRGAGQTAQEGNLGEYLGQGAGSAAVNIGSFFIPGADAAEGANLAAHAGEAAGAASKLAEGGAALGDAGKLAKGGEALGDAAKLEKGGEAVGDASKLEGGAEDAGKVEFGSKNDADAASAKAEVKPAIRQRSFASLDEFNAAANNAEPHTEYKFGNYTWTTDGQGRTIEASGKVNVHEFGRNDTKLQTQIGKEGRTTDIGFHLIADSLDGPTNRLNVVPGNGKRIGDGLPNLNQGDYAKFERSVKNLAQSSDKPVEIRVRAEYNPGNTSSRPDRLIASFRQEGGPWQDQDFVNK